jgi:prevent-host-death family protein
MNEIVDIHIARTKFLRLLAKAEAGHTIIIARNGAPVVKLVPVAPKRKRKFGALRAKLTIGPDFFAPLPEDELAAWER